VKRRKGVRVANVERRTLVTQPATGYAGGAGMRRFAVWTGRSYGFVDGPLREVGAPLRARR